MHRKTYVEYSVRHRRRISSELARKFLEAGSTEPNASVLEDEEFPMEMDAGGISLDRRGSESSESSEPPQDLIFCSSDTSEDIEDQVFDSFQQWASVGVAHVKVSELLKILRQHHCFGEWPADVRTLLSTPRVKEVKNIGGGHTAGQLESSVSSQLQRISACLEKMEVRQEEMNVRLGTSLRNLATRISSLESTQKVLYDKVNEGLLSISRRPAHQSQTVSFPFPLNYWDEFLEVMERVKEEEVKEQMIMNLSRVGGRDLTTLVNRILSRIMTNSLAESCNWKGQRGNKHPLEKSPLLLLVHGAVIRHVGWERTTEDEVKSRIQYWLKQAGRRQKEGSC